MTKILVVGVAVLDFIFQMQEFPRTAEKYRADGAAISGGGNAANAAVAISRLGGEAHLAARLGDDQIADLILNDLTAEGVETELVKRFPLHRSSFSSIYLDAAGERQIMNYRDTSLSMNADWVADTKPTGLKAVLADTRWPLGAIEAMKIARSKNIPGVIDAETPFDGCEEALHLASHIAFSAQGLRGFTDTENLEQAAAEADALLEGIVLVTDGARGTLEMRAGQPIWHPAFPIDPVDTLAAGGYLAWGIYTFSW